MREIDLSVGSPFGWLADFVEGRTPFEPANNVLYKYGRREYLEALGQRGEIRISPVTHFNDTVAFTGSVGDSKEGRVRMDIREGDLIRENRAFSDWVGTEDTIMSPAGGIWCGNKFPQTPVVNTFIWCASSTLLPVTVVKKMSSSYDSVAVIRDWIGFFIELSHKMIGIGYAYDAAIGVCDYSGSQTAIVWKHPQFKTWRKVIPRAFQKVPAGQFVEQNEVRIVFFGECNRPAFTLAIPEISKFVADIRPLVDD